MRIREPQSLIRQSIESFKLEKTSHEILEALQRFSKQWNSFSDVVQKLGRQMETTQKTYEELTGPRQRMLAKELNAIDVLKSQGASTDDPAPAARPRELREVQIGEQGRLGA